MPANTVPAAQRTKEFPARAHSGGGRRPLLPTRDPRGRGRRDRRSGGNQQDDAVSAFSSKDDWWQSTARTATTTEGYLGEARSRFIPGMHWHNSAGRLRGMAEHVADRDLGGRLANAAVELPEKIIRRAALSNNRKIAHRDRLAGLCRSSRPQPAGTARGRTPHHGGGRARRGGERRENRTSEPASSHRRGHR